MQTMLGKSIHMSHIFHVPIPYDQNIPADLRHLRQFLAVAEERSFTRAAERLGMAQPPLSQAIRKLEDGLGARLFVRTSRSVELTEPGRVLFQQATSLLEQHERAIRSVKQAAEGTAGHLEVCFVMSSGYELLPKVLRHFRMKVPGVSISLNELSTAQQVDALQSGRCDVGLLRPPIFGGSDLTVETVLQEPIVVALPEDHRFAKKKRVALADLADEAFISPPARLGPGLYARILDICLASGFVPKIEQEANQMQTIASLVAGGLGVALVPNMVASLGLKGVVFRPVSTRKPVPPVEIALAWQRAEAKRRPYIQKFLEIVKEVCDHDQVS